MLNRSLEVRCSPLDGLLDLPLCHTRGRLIVHSVADALALGVKAGGNADAVSGAGLARDFLYGGHLRSFLVAPIRRV